MAKEMPGLIFSALVRRLANNLHCAYRLVLTVFRFVQLTPSKVAIFELNTPFQNHILWVSHRHNFAHFQCTFVSRHAPSASRFVETCNSRIRVRLSTVAIFGNARGRCRRGIQASVSALDSDFAFQLQYCCEARAHTIGTFTL